MAEKHHLIVAQPLLIKFLSRGESNNNSIAFKSIVPAQ
jgi:hypothetical protein